MAEKRARKVKEIVLIPTAKYDEFLGADEVGISDCTQMKDVVALIKSQGVSGEFVALREIGRIKATEQKQLKLEVS